MPDDQFLLRDCIAGAGLGWGVGSEENNFRIYGSLVVVYVKTFTRIADSVGRFQFGRGLMP
jgi:hypothetical protein